MVRTSGVKGCNLLREEPRESLLLGNGDIRLSLMNWLQGMYPEGIQMVHSHTFSIELLDIMLILSILIVLKCIFKH